MPKINFKGVQYDSPSEMPPDVRAAYEKAAAMLPDRDGNGVPDLLESDNQTSAAAAAQPAAPQNPRANVSPKVAGEIERVERIARWLPAIVVVAILGVLLCVGLVFFMIMNMMKSNGAHELAMEIVRNNPTVEEALGKPVVEDMFVSGSVSENGASGSAELSIPLSGSRASGTLEVQAVKQNGQWKIVSMYLDTGSRRYNIEP